MRQHSFLWIRKFWNTDKKEGKGLCGLAIGKRAKETAAIAWLLHMNLQQVSNSYIAMWLKFKMLAFSAFWWQKCKGTEYPVVESSDWYCLSRTNPVWLHYCWKHCLWRQQSAGALWGNCYCSKSSQYSFLHWLTARCKLFPFFASQNWVWTKVAAKNCVCL